MASLFALRKAAVTDINKGNLDKAVEKLQKLVRLSKGSDGATSECIALWSLLGESYKQKGNIPSAIRVCLTIKELAPDYSASLQLIELFRITGDYDRSIEEARSLQNSNLCPTQLITYFHLSYAQTVILSASRAPLLEQKLKLLDEAFILLKPLYKENRSVMVEKLFAVALGVVQKVNPSQLSTVCQRLGLEMNKLQLVEQRLEMLSAVLSTNTQMPDSWNDVALCLLDVYEMQSDCETFAKVEKCFTEAIKLPSSAQKRSSIWLNFGIAYTRVHRPARAQHCFIRALQLDRQNDRAFACLAITAMRCGNYAFAGEALSNAQQINPDLMQTWCGQAIHAENASHFDAMDLYRHAIVLKPNTYATQKFAYFMSENLRMKNRINDSTMINFELMFDLHNLSHCDDNFFISCALLAEAFWYIEKSVDFISKVSPSEDTVCHFRRMAAKSTSPIGPKDECLEALYQMSKEDLMLLIERIPAISEIIDTVVKVDITRFRHVYTPRQFPLIVVYCILFDTPFNLELFNVINEVRPLHRLASVFPMDIVKPEELTVENAKETDAIIVRDDFLTKRLQNFLLQRQSLFN